MLCVPILFSPSIPHRISILSIVNFSLKVVGAEGLALIQNGVLASGNTVLVGLTVGRTLDESVNDSYDNCTSILRDLPLRQLVQLALQLTRFGGLNFLVQQIVDGFATVGQGGRGGSGHQTQRPLGQFAKGLRGEGACKETVN